MSGRVGADFTACPTTMASRVACAQPSEGSFPALVKVTAGPGGGFGGTLGLVLNAGTFPSRFLLHFPVPPLANFVFADLATGSKAAGRGYAVRDTDTIHGTFYEGYSTTPMGRLTGTMDVGPFPPALVMNFGFPFTTGTVIVCVTGATAVNSYPAGGTFRIAGFDTSTSMGARNIQLVAGQVSSALLDSSGAPSYSVLRLPEPAFGAQG